MQYALQYLCAVGVTKRSRCKKAKFPKISGEVLFSYVRWFLNHMPSLFSEYHRSETEQDVKVIETPHEIRPLSLLATKSGALAAVGTLNASLMVMIESAHQCKNLSRQN